MDSHALAVLEFDKVRALLAEGAASALGLEAVAELAPITDLDRLRVWQEQTSEVRAILDEGHDLPLGGLHDLRGIVRHVGLGGVATAADLLGVAETLRCLERLKRFVGEREQAPRLGEVAADLVALPGLADELERCIGDDGEVADDASPELRKLRHQARNVAARVQTSLRRILGDLARSEAVQDAVVTIRQGRYCVPIKATHQGQFEGIIHDRSASGQTVFVEPAEVVRLNNELRDAQLAEREEVQRILRELSGQVALHADDLEANLARLTVLDLARARGRLSARLDGVEPELAEDGRFVFRQARHPLLVQQLGRQVVPIDLELGDGFTTLLITGPNTGGKTVSLKTVGLLTLMAQAGLHVPAEPGTRIALRRRVFADIGDEQSIEQSLSTFGAHLKQVVAILEEASEQDLVLLDELGAGTDPSEGAALAEAVLTALHERGCRVIATTHHGSLKHFAYQMEGVENASVEFDRRSLAPTYRLLVGIPGASHALEIAGRYGMPPEVLERAADILPKEHHDAATMIHQMQRSRQRLDREVRAAEHEAAIASHARRELEDERRRLRELEREIRDEAQREAA
ncbi:MAG: endonuclease MutS2, partial [Armatimonadetes bacterium]|nr:endonuclease MutS2 [Armatimonadota bacterium]